MGCPWGTQPRSHLPPCVTIIIKARHLFPRCARSWLSSPRLTEPPAGAGAAALGRSTAAPRPPRGLRPLSPAGAAHTPPGSRSPAGAGKGLARPREGEGGGEGSPAPTRPATAAIRGSSTKFPGGEESRNLRERRRQRSRPGVSFPPCPPLGTAALPSASNSSPGRLPGASRSPRALLRCLRLREPRGKVLGAQLWETPRPLIPGTLSLVEQFLLSLGDVS